jgi:hypothetical protein
VAGVGGKDGRLNGEAPFRENGCCDGCLGSIAPGAGGNPKQQQSCVPKGYLPRSEFSAETQASAASGSKGRNKGQTMGGATRCPGRRHARSLGQRWGGGERSTLGAGEHDKFCALFLSGLRSVSGERGGWIARTCRSAPTRQTRYSWPELVASTTASGLIGRWARCANRGRCCGWVAKKNKSRAGRDSGWCRWSRAAGG